MFRFVLEWKNLLGSMGYLSIAYMNLSCLWIFVDLHPNLIRIDKMNSYGTQKRFEPYVGFSPKYILANFPCCMELYSTKLFVPQYVCGGHIFPFCFRIEHYSVKVLFGYVNDTPQTKQN